MEATRSPVTGCPKDNLKFTKFLNTFTYFLAWYTARDIWVMQLRFRIEQCEISGQVACPAVRFLVLLSPELNWQFTFPMINKAMQDLYIWILFTSLSNNLQQVTFLYTCMYSLVCTCIMMAYCTTAGNPVHNEDESASIICLIFPNLPYTPHSISARDPFY